MREGKENKSPSSEDKTQSTGSLGGLGYTIPGIRLSDDFRARLKACDAVALQSTLKQDAANLAAQLDRFNSATLSLLFFTANTNRCGALNL